MSMSATEREKKYATKLNALLKEAQHQFLSLHDNFPCPYPFTNTFKTNALPCGSGSIVGAVYPIICFINHSCDENAHNNWNKDAGHETNHATRDIQAQEAITIRYDRGDVFMERRASLKRDFGFDRACSVCSQSTSETKTSDGWRVRIQELDEGIGDPFAMMSTLNVSLCNCYGVLQFLNEEYNGGDMISGARHTYDAFQICAAHSDRARASVFVERAY